MNLRILRGGCVGDDVVYEASAGRGTDPGEPPMLAAGTYGFEATASDSDGKVVAFVCTERTLPGDGPIGLELASRSGACGATVDGGPRGSDAGDSDAGGSDDAGGQNTPDEGCGDLDADGCDDCSYSSTPDPSLDGPEIDADGLCDCVVFADASIVGQGDGKRWSTAFASLQTAVDRAAELGPDCEVWIRQGTYYGYTTAVTDGLRLVRDIDLYGGFVGGELRRDQRTQDASLTLLDGRSRDSSGQRVAHVIVGADATRIEDLTIVGGDASGALRDGQGGGMLNVEVTTSLRNVVFRTNHAALGGGAMHNLRSNVTLTRCIFEGNTSGASGGAIAHEDGTLTVVRAQFRDNQAADALFGGGAIYQRNGTAEFENCLFARNDAVRWGGGFLGEASTTQLTNCTVAGNTATQGAGVMGINAAAIGVVNSIVHRNTSEALRANSGATFNVTYSNIQGGYAGAGNVMGNPAFVDPNNGDYHLLSTSPCIDAADGDAAPNFDLEGNPRQDLPVGDLGRGNPSYVDMGAYEFLP